MITKLKVERICEGNCSEHIGEVVPCRVKKLALDCIYETEHEYCNAAINKEIFEGNMVEIIK